MTIYAIYIYDRHCECVYYQDWHRTRTPRPPQDGNFRPGVARYGNVVNGPKEISTGGRVVAVGDDASKRSSVVAASQSKGLPFDEEAKLVYGVVLSLRNMVKKLSGRDEAFVNYRTSAYKLHLYETLTGYKFVLLSDPAADSLKFVLRQIYTGPFLEHVVRNPLVEMDSRETGVDNDQLRGSIDKYIRGLSVFGP